MDPAAIDVTALRRVAEHLEPDRTLAAALAPTAARPSLMALAAFAAELRNIARVVREPMMGELRLQWWRDALDAMERGAATGNPAADALGAAMRTYALPKGLLLGVVDARAVDIESRPWPDRRAQQTTLIKGEGALFLLAARVLGAASGDAQTRAAADAAGFAYGMSRNLLDLPHALARGNLPLSSADVASHDGMIDDLRSGTATPAIRLLLDRVVHDASDTLAHARIQVAAVPKAQIAAFLPLVMVEPYLRGVLKKGRNPLRDVFEVMPLTRVWRVGWASWLGRI